MEATWENILEVAFAVLGFPVNMRGQTVPLLADASEMGQETEQNSGSVAGMESVWGKTLEVALLPWGSQLI